MFNQTREDSATQPIDGWMAEFCNTFGRKEKKLSFLLGWTLIYWDQSIQEYNYPGK